MKLLVFLTAPFVLSYASSSHDIALSSRETAEVITTHIQHRKLGHPPPPHPPPGGGSGGSSSSSSGGSSGSSGGSGSSSGGGSGSSSGGSGSSGGGSGSSGGRGSSSGGGSSPSSSTGTGGSNNKGPVRTVMDQISGARSTKSGLMWTAALIALALLVGLIILALFLSRRKKKKEAKKQLLNLEEEDEEAGYKNMAAAAMVRTVSSSSTVSGDSSVEMTAPRALMAPFGVPAASESEDGPQPTSGVYQSEDARLQLTFQRANPSSPTSVVEGSEDEADDAEYYHVSGSGYEHAIDSHMDAIAITISNGRASKDGKTVSWREERRPHFFKHKESKAFCPRPKCSSACKTETGAEEGGFPRTFSVDGQKVHVVECTGEFDYEKNTFVGHWERVVEDKNKVYHSFGNYDLALKKKLEPFEEGEENSSSFFEEEEETARKSPKKRMMKGLARVFGRRH